MSVCEIQPSLQMPTGQGCLPDVGHIESDGEHSNVGFIRMSIDNISRHRSLYFIRVCYLRVWWPD